MTTDAVAERLAALEQHVDYPQAMRHAPRSSAAVMAALGIALTGGGGVIGVVAPTAVVRTVGWCLALAGVACLAVAVFFASTPLERVLAVVASERIPTDRRDGAAGRRHYTTLERLDGIKREYRASRELIDRLADGDAGVAYLKAGFLLDFRHLR